MRRYFRGSLVVTALTTCRASSYLSLFASVVSVACNLATDPMWFPSQPDAADGVPPPAASTSRWRGGRVRLRSPGTPTPRTSDVHRRPRARQASSVDATASGEGGAQRDRGQRSRSDASRAGRADRQRSATPRRPGRSSPGDWRDPRWRSVDHRTRRRHRRCNHPAPKPDGRRSARRVRGLEGQPPPVTMACISATRSWRGSAVVVMVPRSPPEPSLPVQVAVHSRRR